ncbi:MAG TPA: DUF2630 family protein [Ignavibacteriaceae bacterium]|jgi:hypothetical protein|nr:DUF2630 family protein [Ignavibacteriaceae bacterium]
MMTDQEVMDKIKALLDKEHKLYSKDGLSLEERKEVEKLQVELDRYWDLLRQRRALKEYGDDPDKANLRGTDTVENYEQ